MQRIFALDYHAVMTMSKGDLIKTIRASEGRTVMAETIVSVLPLVYGVSNPELAAAFGADMITLNFFDFDAPFIFGLDDTDIDLAAGPGALAELAQKMNQTGHNREYARDVKRVVGRFLGVNLEPVAATLSYPAGRKLSRENLEKAGEFGFDYVVVTGNPNTGVTDQSVLKGVELAAEVLGDKALIVAGKMHAAGGENIYSPVILKEFVRAGADVVLIPAPGTVPGMDQELARRQIAAIHEAGALAMTAIGTSQESAGERVIEQMALMAKMAGADIQHIGDAGWAGVAFPENILALSVAIRGKRHTYRRMGYSLRK